MGLDFRRADHLPNLRSGRDPWDPHQLPRQRRGMTAQMHGRYPDSDVLDQARHWDERTRSVVYERIEHVPELRFFDASEAATLASFCDVVTAQDAEPRIPVLASVDAKLYEGRLDGYQYAGMPDDRDVWRLVARGLDEAAHGSFAGAGAAAQADIVAAFARGELRGGTWQGLDTGRAWSVVIRAVIEAFYSHPWAWNEIGFSGPAYPRGYAALGVGLSEPWEGTEVFEVDPVRDVQNRGIE